MSTTSWQEAVDAAHAFARRWDGERRERAEKDTFWNEFLAIFGVSRRRVASFEPAARRYSTGRNGYIDLFWPGRLLVEQKSHGSNLDAAMAQALDYLPGMADEDVPQVVVACNFQNFRIRDLDEGTTVEFPLKDLPKRLDSFRLFADGLPASVVAEDLEDVNLAATELLADLHDALRHVGYDDHQRRILLTRLLFCLFADDAQVWPRGIFHDYLLLRTADDGADLGAALVMLFEILDTPLGKRPTSMANELREFSYINGGLFAERLPMAWCDRAIRQSLLRACRFNWSKISPAIFGSMFQNVMTTAERRSLGAHYTTEGNILKTIGPLFLDELETELAVTTTKKELQGYIAKLAGLTFLDPACGCGNFLIIAYRELRRLELAALVKLRALTLSGATARKIRRGQVAMAGQLGLDATWESKVHVGQFFGIEIEEFPCRIAETAMHLMDHLANLQLSMEFGQYYARFPITRSAHIQHGNALRIEWTDVLPAEQCDFVLGNPPFVGKSLRTARQSEDLALAHGSSRASGLLDYVTGWYAKAADYITGTNARVAFVSTNSITQGEQVGLLWPSLHRMGVVIDFAHRTFTWTSEARGKAHVHVVIIGFSMQPGRVRRVLHDYLVPEGKPIEIEAQQINPYLVDAPFVAVERRGSSINDGVPSALFGSKPTDGGHLLVTGDELAEFEADPIATRYLRKFVGATELLYNAPRWCLWLSEASPRELRESEVLARRLRAVRQARRASSKEATRRLGDVPARFEVNNQPAVEYLALPQTSSERRLYIPGQVLGADVVANNGVVIVPGAELWVVGLFQSAMFTAWVRTVSGRLKSDFQISPRVVCNTFPFPGASGAQRARIASAMQDVLDAREAASPASLADLYDPIAMPYDLLQAHRKLDRAVESAYGMGVVQSEGQRLSVLFQRYAELANELPAIPVQGAPVVVSQGAERPASDRVT